MSRGYGQFIRSRKRVAKRGWWLVVGDDDVNVCLKDPGYDVDAIVSADMAAFVRVLLGHVRLARAASQT